MAGCRRLSLHVVLLFFKNIKRTSAFWYRPCSDDSLYHRRTIHFTAEELLTGQFSSWAEIQCSSPSPRGAQEHSCMPNRIHPDCSRLGAADISWVVRYYWSKQTLQTHFTIFNQQKMLRRTIVSSTNYILQLQEMIEWPFAVHLFIIVALPVLFCKIISMEELFPKLQSHIINNWETGSTWNPTQPRHLKLIKGLRTSWTQSHLKSEIDYVWLRISRSQSLLSESLKRQHLGIYCCCRPSNHFHIVYMNYPDLRIVYFSANMWVAKV